MTSTSLARTLLVANQKGGVGKSSLVSALGSLVAASGRKVLLVDSDQQANLTNSDLGAEGDRGRSLGMTLQYGEPLVPLTGVRENLDLIPGGPVLAAVSATAALSEQQGIDMAGNLSAALAKLQVEGGYDLILIDSGPGDAPLLDALLATASHLLVPTKDDDASLSGVELLAARYQRARANGAAIQLLGVVLFDANPRATVRNRDVFESIEEILGDSGVQAFRTFIRSDKASAVDMRNRHVTPAELVELAEANKLTRIEVLRQTISGQLPPGKERLWSRDPSGLASDYLNLTREVLTRLAEAPALSGGVA